MTPVIRVPVAFAGIVGRAQHRQVRDLQGEVRPGFAAVDVVHVEVFAFGQLMLVAATQLAAAVVRPQGIVAEPPPLRCLQKRRRGYEPCCPAMRIPSSPQKPEKPEDNQEQGRSDQSRLKSCHQLSGSGQDEEPCPVSTTLRDLGRMASGCECICLGGLGELVPSFRRASGCGPSA